MIRLSFWWWYFTDDDPEDRRGEYEVDKKTDKADIFRFFVTSKRLLIFSLSAISSHIIENTDSSSFLTTSTTAKIHKKRGPKPASEEVLLQGAVRAKNKVAEG